MKLLRYSALFWLSLFLVVGCAVVDEAKPQPQDSQARITAKSSVVASFFSARRYHAGQRFAWRPGAERYFDDPRIKDPSIKPLLENAIQQTLVRSGYQFSPDARHADFLVGYLVALESKLNDQAIAEIYGSAPGLQMHGSEDYEKGTLIIDIVGALDKQPVWRGAMQAAVSFDVDRLARQQRITAAVETVLSNFLRVN